MDVLDDPVRMWRAQPDDRVLWMAGRTDRYAIEPRGEYVFGLVEEAPMRSTRDGERRVVAPGSLVAWDPSAPHAGTAAHSRPWRARLMLVEVGGPLAGARFPDPVVTDREVITGFVALHAAFAAPSTRLERDERLAEWLALVVDRAASQRPPAPAVGRDDRAVRAALDYLGDHADRNVGLDELANAAGVDKFRLLRLVRERTGLPPHALQLAHRIRHARRRLEAGEAIADVAYATGFADQSHLHRHFRRSLGLTPAHYQRRFRR